MRSKPMKVLVMGVGRTGTTSLTTALKEYGFTPYDFPDRYYGGHNPRWDAAMMAKFYGVGQPIGKEELDQLTGDFDCVLDTPCCFFAEEFCAAYPDAKVVANSRDFDSWFRSMTKTIFAVVQWPSWQVLQYTDPKFARPWFKHVALTLKVFCDNDYKDRDKCKRRFEEHYEHLRKVIPKERLLEYQIQDGWDPLVKFLGLNNRSGGMPSSNLPEEFIVFHAMEWKESMGRSVKNMAKVMVGLVAAAGIVVSYFKS